MLYILSRALIMLLLLTLFTGIAYPLAVTGLAQILFPAQANGSMIKRDGKPVGSALIGQNFNSPSYFHGRPSAAGINGYDPTSSGGTNLGPTNSILVTKIAMLAAQLRKENGLPANAALPSELVTASASGLDPHISPGAALVQVSRVAKARGLVEATVKDLVNQYTEGRQFGILGEPRVNVLKLNLAMDKLRKAR